MTQGELEKIPQKIVGAMSQLQIHIMQDIVRRIQINGFSTASADWQFNRLQQLGMSETQIKAWVQEILDVSDEEIDRIYSDETYQEYMGHQRGYELYGRQQIPYEENVELQQTIEAVKQQTKDELENITGSMGFVKPTPAGNLQTMTLTEFYQKTLDDAMYDINSGAFDYNTVLKRTIEDMTRSGIRWIDYDSGHHNRIPVAARRAVMTGFRQVQGKINEQVARDLNTDSYEVTVHIGARPTHQPWEGKVWTMEQLHSVCGLGTVTGLHGANCYHDYNPFIPGVSVRTYTDEQLDQIHEAENTPKTYNGKEYTTYEALQRQRELETRARKYREDAYLLEQGGGSEEDIIAKKARYQGTLQEYHAFSKKMDLPMQKERIYQDGLKVDMKNQALLKNLQDTTDKWSRDARAELFKDEITKANRQKEIMTVYDQTGNYLFTRWGDINSVSIKLFDIPKLRGAIVSHNHPSGGSFSVADIDFARRYGISEIRVSTADRSFYLRRPKTWPKGINSRKKIQNEIDLIKNDLKEKHAALYNQGVYKTKAERHKMFTHDVLLTFAEKFNLDYGVEYYGNQIEL